ncbi:hypothetical protein AAG570_012632 [Ranatra chinensis]|uniref:RNA-binding protein 48 n=1 Tax=Ranatra chinensis TaxID=642074 RepID=A0ABD0YWW5_9HEMI
MSEKIAVNLPHHKSKQLCTTRTPYRQGNKLTAVKVYTITKESQHLLIFNVPSLGLESELLKFCKKFGKVSGFHLVTDYKKESLDLFTCVFHIFYADLKSSRFAKKKLDNHVFYGSSLHVCYAPELESLDETRIKLQHRRKEISLRIKMNNSGHKEFQCK